MPWNEASDQLTTIAEQAEEWPQWSAIARYCRLRARGLRRDAFAELSEFISNAVSWPFAERLHLCLWLVRRADPWIGGQLIPHPLHVRILAPTLLEWVEAEPANADAHYWVGTLGGTTGNFPLGPFHFRRAIALDPGHDPARVALARWLESGVDYAQHHLPDFYIGDVEYDLRDLQEAKSVIEPVRDQVSIDFLRNEIEKLTEIALE